MTRANGVGARGFSVVEVLVSVALVSIGLVGLGMALQPPSGGVAGGIGTGLTAINQGGMVSVAAFLAAARMEEMKNTPYTSATDQITPERFPNEGYGQIAGFEAYRRAVTILTGSPGPNQKTLTVTVSFRPLSGNGLGGEQAVQLQTIAARRP